MYENKVIVMGRLTKKPELKSYGNGESMVALNIAVNSVWIDKNTNEKKESVEFISTLVFGKKAETCATYLDQGQVVYVEGKIKNRVEETEQGKRYHTGIVAEKVQFGPKAKPDGTEQDKPSYNAPQASQPRKNDYKDPLAPIDYPKDEINVDDIPF